MGLLGAWGGAHCWQGRPTGPMGAGGRGAPFLCTLTAGSGRNLACQVCEMDPGMRVLWPAPSCTGSVTSPESALSSKAGLLTRAGGSGPPLPLGQGRRRAFSAIRPPPARIPGSPSHPTIPGRHVGTLDHRRRAAPWGPVSTPHPPFSFFASLVLSLEPGNIPGAQSWGQV